MATDYEKFYRENPHGLGEPTKEFVEFFDSYDHAGSKVLDVGCGQGRDAIFIARHGHAVTAIDQSPSGIKDLQEDARSKGLDIKAEVADIRDYDSKCEWDVIVIDRTLHMLDPDDRLVVLRKLIKATHDGTHILIADERSNIPAFKGVLEASQWSWATTLERRGFLFVQRCLPPPGGALEAYVRDRRGHRN